MRTRLALTRSDVETGTCPAPEGCDLAGLTVVLDHRDRGLRTARHTFAGAVEQGRLTGLTWPPDIRPGVRVTLSWQPGKTTVGLRTTALDEPMRIDSANFYHEYDPIVVTREFDPGNSNRGRVLHAVRSLGRVYADGSAVFPEAELLRRGGLGRGARGAFLLRNAVDQLIREGYVTRVPGSIDADGRPGYPATAGETPADMLFYAPLVEPAAHPAEAHDGDGDGSDRREHWVNGFVRKLPPGANISEKQLAAYHRAYAEAQLEPPPLEPGYTFVKKHHRNG